MKRIVCAALLLVLAGCGDICIAGCATSPGDGGDMAVSPDMPAFCAFDVDTFDNCLLAP
jgi:hypothetical protein